MRLKQQWCSVLLAAMLVGPGGVTVVAAVSEQFLPVLGRREGARDFCDPADKWLHRLFHPAQRARRRHQRREIGLGRVRNRLRC